MREYFKWQEISAAYKPLPLKTPYIRFENWETSDATQYFRSSRFYRRGHGWVLPRAGRAADIDLFQNVVFTESNPGHWKGLEVLHVPVVTVTGSMLTVRTSHPMTEPHFIVSHSVVLAAGALLGRKTFTYIDQPVSEYTLPAGHSGKITITTTCNLHDLWIKVVSV